MPEITRRTALRSALVLTAAAAGAALGTTRPVHHKIAEPPPAPPAALTSLLAGEQSLLAGYDAALSSTGHPALAALRIDVRQHIDALRALLEHYPGWRYAEHRATSTTGVPSPTGSSSSVPSASASVPPVAGSITSLAAATRSLARESATACVGWSVGEEHAGQAVPLLGCISAALSTHLEVLQ